MTDPAPNPHATEEQVAAALKDSKLAQVLYHDWEAESYDDKWSISYDQRCIDYARGRFDAIVGTDVGRDLPYGHALELGCGTGFFLLNLIQAGVARRGSVTDLSPGMVKVATRNGKSLGLDVDGRVADAEGIPYGDDTFDLVVGHAVLHHIPDVEKSLSEVVRVLKPGGRLVVISFHSLEDRIVKQFIAEHAREVYDRRNPFAAPKTMALKALGRSKPCASEIAANPRARSAVMRVAQRLPHAPQAVRA